MATFAYRANPGRDDTGTSDVTATATQSGVTSPDATATFEVL